MLSVTPWTVRTVAAVTPRKMRRDLCDIFTLCRQTGPSRLSPLLCVSPRKSKSLAAKTPGGMIKSKYVPSHDCSAHTAHFYKRVKLIIKWH